MHSVKYIAFLDSDDLWHRKKLATHIAHLELKKTVGVSYSPSILIDADSNPIGITQSPKLTDVTNADIFLRNPVGNGSTPVIRRDALGDITFKNDAGEPCWFDESFQQSEDIECWMRLALQTDWEFEGVADALTLYRINESGLSANIMRQFQSWQRMCEKVKKTDPSFYRRWGRLSEAFQLRYLARRAARMRCGSAAFNLTLRAIRCDLHMIIREPLKTFTTLAAACALCALPRSSYERLEKQALGYFTAMRRRESV